VAGDDTETVRRYHERTKHHPRRYARSPGYLDWATQPDPFRQYQGATEFSLDRPVPDGGPAWGDLIAAAPAPRATDRAAIGELFYYSLALSAWKEAGSSRWSLRVNPSSGDLHPTEAYLIAGPLPGLNPYPAVYHYSPFRHALELRIALSGDEWTSLAKGLPAGGVLLALASIPWRESWKYGERAFRYCHHDVGHAICAVGYSARLLGWAARLVTAMPDGDLDELLGLRRQRETSDVEVEHPDCLLALAPTREPWFARGTLPEILRHRLRSADFQGTPNRLSQHQQPWPVIAEAVEASRYGGSDGEAAPDPAAPAGATPPAPPARLLIRRRRSAVAMDGHTTMTRESFYRILVRLAPALGSFPHEVLPWPPRVSLAFFVHRVDDLPQGLYLLVRHPDHFASLRSSLDRSFVWEKPGGLPGGLEFFQLAAADMREAAQLISCHQEIAGAGVFSLGMLARFDAALSGAAWNYPRLFWECGLLGQILYLEAEAAGVRGTGIGCFFDDTMHELLGITDTAWQSLYHFAVGGALDDPRLKTLESYFHLEPRSGAS
jgi:SagB-type dehydrogenase family enzyme